MRMMTKALTRARDLCNDGDGDKDGSTPLHTTHERMYAF